MDYGLCIMSCGLCIIDYILWVMTNGSWSMYCVWITNYGLRIMDYEFWIMCYGL